MFDRATNDTFLSSIQRKLAARQRERGKKLKNYSTSEGAKLLTSVVLHYSGRRIGKGKQSPTANYLTL